MIRYGDVLFIIDSDGRYSGGRLIHYSVLTIHSIRYYSVMTERPVFPILLKSDQ